MRKKFFTDFTIFSTHTITHHCTLINLRTHDNDKTRNADRIFRKLYPARNIKRAALRADCAQYIFFRLKAVGSRKHTKSVSKYSAEAEYVDLARSRSNRKTLTALGTAAFENIAAVLGFHACSEPMNLRATAFLGLICTLWHKSTQSIRFLKPPCQLLREYSQTLVDPKEMNTKRAQRTRGKKLSTPYPYIHSFWRISAELYPVDKIGIILAVVQHTRWGD